MFNTIPETKGNPIFSSYSVRDADFNENMDEYIKAPNDIYIEERKRTAAERRRKERNINVEAINNIEEFPAFLDEEFGSAIKKPAWQEELEKNVYTPEDEAEWKKQGAMGIGEVARQKVKWLYTTPYAGSSAETTLLIRNANTLRRLKNGEEVSNVDKELLYDFLRDAKEQEVRGVTLGGKALDISRTSLGYAIEFGLGFAAAGGGVGLALIGKTLTDIGAKKAARKAVEAALKEAAVKSAAPAAVKTTVPLSAAKKIYKDTLVKTTGAKALSNVGVKEGLKETAKGLPRAVGSSAVFGSTYMSPHLIGDIASRQLATGIYITDFGDAVLTDSENLALSIMKALGNSTFETLTETAGWIFSPVASYFAKPVRSVLPEKFFTGFEKLISSRYGMPAAKALKKYGFDGVLEEMGEEQLNRFLCQTFGINGLDEYNFDGFMKNVFYFDKEGQTGTEGFKTGLKNMAEGYGTEALSFAALGGAGHLAAGASAKISDEREKRKLTQKANEYISSPSAAVMDKFKNETEHRLEQFYLDQGLIKINGSQSLAEQGLREVWRGQSIDENLQNEVLKNMSETEIRSELKKSVEENGNTTLSKTDTKRREIEDEAYQKFIKAGVSKDIAFANAKLFGLFFNQYGADNQEAFDNWYSKFKTRYDVPAAAPGDLQQSAMYKSPKRSFEEFYNQVQKNQNPKQKAYFTQKTNGGVDIDIFHDVVRHDEKKHSLTEEEWAEVFNSIDENIVDKVLAAKSYYKGAPVLLKINSGKNYYGVAIEIFPDRNIITTAFKSTSKGVDTWIEKDKKKSAKTTAPNHQSGSSITQGNNVILGQTLNDIITDVKAKLKSDVNTLFQSADSAGAANNAQISAAQKEWKEKGTESSYFKNWFKDSKVVDENGKPLVVYHGTNAEFDSFDRSKLSSAYGSNNGFYFANKEVADGYGKTMPVYLKMDNPYIINVRHEIDELLFDYESAEEAEQYGYRISHWEGKTREDFEAADSATAYIDDNNEEIFDRAKENNADGIIIEGTDGSFVYVAFNPEQIKSVNNQGTFDGNNPNIYYQSKNDNVVDLTNEFEKTPTIDEVKAYINEVIEQGTKFATLSPDWFVDVKGGKRTKNKILNAGNYKNLDRKGKERHNKFVMSLEKLLNNAEYTGEKENTKKDKKPNVAKYHYFKTTVKIGGKTYELIFDTEEYINDNPQGADTKTVTSKEHPADNNIITDNTGNFNPKTVHLYNIKELKQPKTFYQSAYSSKTIKKAQEVKSALQKIADGSNEETVKNLRDDLEQYGGTNDVTFVFGDDKKGIQHIAQKHGVKTLLKVFDTVIDGKVLRFVKNKKTVILEKNGVEAVLSLDENGNKKTWLLTGYNTKISPDEKEQVRTNSNPTQIKPTFGRQDLGAELNNIITDETALFNPNINNGEAYYQEEEDYDNLKLIAGYTYQEVADKSTELYNEIANGADAETQKRIMAKIHVLEDAFDLSENPNKFSNEAKRRDVFLNAYYIMNDQEIPEDYIEDDIKTQRTYRDLRDIHMKKKEQAQDEYYGYFTEGTEENVMTIMSNHNASTALHELGHLFLNGLNEMAKTSDKAKEQLEAVNKWLGAENGEYTTAQHEKFARSFEAYVYRGKAPNSYLKQVFENFKEWLKSVYHHITDIEDADLSPEVEKLFNNIFGGAGYVQERKEALEILKKVKAHARRDKMSKIAVKKDNKLTPTQKRCKEVSYQILSVATGKDIN